MGDEPKDEAASAAPQDINLVLLTMQRLRIINFIYIIQNMHGKKRLFKSNSDRLISGVIGGASEFFGLDPSLLRLFWVLVTAFTGFFPGLIAYVIAALVIPER